MCEAIDDVERRLFIGSSGSQRCAFGRGNDRIIPTVYQEQFEWQARQILSLEIERLQLGLDRRW